MTIVAEYPWESDPCTHTDTGARAVWRAAVAEIADKARAKLPECNGRVDSAVKIVLAGDVELLPDGTARVASQSNGTTDYHVVKRAGRCWGLCRRRHLLSLNIHVWIPTLKNRPQLPVQRPHSCL
jgi:hypothetical protein